MNGHVVAIVVLAAGGIARGQTYPPETMDFTITLRDAGGNNNGIVEPGEVVDLRVAARFTPGVGQATLWNNYPGSTGAAGTVLYFAGSTIDVIGVQGSAAGSLNWEVSSPVYIGLPGTLDPLTNSVWGSMAGQLPWYWPSQANPIEILRGTWTPAVYQPRTLEYRVDPKEGYIFLLVGLPQPVGEATINAGSQASIQIVPAPGAGWAFGVGAVGLLRRREPR